MPTDEEQEKTCRENMTDIREFLCKAALLAANAVAYWPARSAARLRPARVLRAE